MCWKTSPGYASCEARVCNNALTNPSDANCRSHLATYTSVDQCRYSGTGNSCVVS